MYSRNLLPLIGIISFFWFGYFICTVPVVIVQAADVPPDPVVEINDVVKLNYTLWVDTIRYDDQSGTVYVHDPSDPVFPPEIIEQFPAIYLPPNTGFFEALLGMKAGESKNINILFSQGKAFNNVNDALYGEDLFYTIHLLELVFDASTVTASFSSSASTGSSTPSLTSSFTYLPTLGLVVIYLCYRKK